MVEYELMRMKRKTIAIYVRNNKVEVRAPFWVAKHEIDGFVLLKQNWIEKQLKSENERAHEQARFEIDYGSFVHYKGVKYKITPSSGNLAGISDGNFYVPSGLKTEEVKSLCVKLFKILAKSDLNIKALLYAKLLSVSPSSVKVNSAKTRWGSCSAKGNISFSWMLIMAEDEVVDYVVVHELAHLKEMNHSSRFWALVEQVLPDYKERKKRLKELQTKLANENWD